MSQSITAIHPLALEASEQMLARLEWVTLQPQTILVLDQPDAESVASLRARYPKATVLHDYSHSLAEKQSQINTQTADHSVDLIFANFILPWCQTPEALLLEWQRLLRPEGLLMFSSLGPDTLRAWRTTVTVLPELVDMHNLGDALTQARWLDPVMDVDYVTLSYSGAAKALEELQASQMIRASELSDVSHLQNAEGKWFATFEIVYGHTWKRPHTDTVYADENGVASFPLAHLRRRKGA